MFLSPRLQEKLPGAVKRSKTEWSAPFIWNLHISIILMSITILNLHTISFPLSSLPPASV